MPQQLTARSALTFLRHSEIIGRFAPATSPSRPPRILRVLRVEAFSFLIDAEPVEAGFGFETLQALVQGAAAVA